MASNIDDDQADESMDLSFQDEDLAVGISSAADTLFDETIGHVEDIMMEEDFQQLQHDFLEKYYHEFDDSEENKFIYTDIHREYIQLIETFLNNELTKRISGFSMDQFTKLIIERKNELEGEIFEMLLTFSDFMSFKEMFLDFKADKEGNTVDLSSGITVFSAPAVETSQGFDFSIGNTHPGSQVLDLGIGNSAPNRIELTVNGTGSNGLPLGGASGDGLSLSGCSMPLIGNNHPCAPVASQTMHLDSVQMFDEDDDESLVMNGQLQ